MEPEVRCQQFRRERDNLFSSHPQSALSDEQKSTFTGLRYYPYDPAYRFELPVEPLPEATIVETELQQDGRLRMLRFDKIHLPISGQDVSLSLY